MNGFIFNFFLVIVLPGVCILIGLVSLITQKIYKIDETGKTEVEIPIFGKMTTNYPALVFVFLGLSASIILSGKIEDTKEDWEITGRIISKTPYDFSTSQISMFPQSYQVKGPSKNGDYSITLKLPKNAQFEESIQRFTIETPEKLIAIYPLLEYQQYQKDPEASKLIGKTENSRIYEVKFD